MTNPMLLITGTGRCGTGYISQVLNSAGVDCGHERIFNLNGWNYAQWYINSNPNGQRLVESSWLAAPHLHLVKKFWPDAVIVHLVRHPKPTIDSALRVTLSDHAKHGGYFQYLREHLDDFYPGQHPEWRAVKWYLELNQMIEPHASARHRVEDDVRELLDWLEIPYYGRELFDDRTYNSRVGHGHADIDLDKLPSELSEPLYEMAERYGYRCV